ncbi:MAG: DUF3592 domain-containing protein [Pirellulales bacterium]
MDYSPKIKYNFIADGGYYTGTKISYKTSYASSRKANAESIIQKYAKGTVHQVSYDPNDPSICTLEPGRSFKVYLPILLYGSWSL